jgi:hypothetical protein
MDWPKVAMPDVALANLSPKVGKIMSKPNPAINAMAMP